MRGERIPVKVLSVQRIPNAAEGLCHALSLPRELRSIGLLSSDCDDATYIALDAATKAANVSVVYGASLYAGAANATTALAGEVIGILGGRNPSEIESGLQAALECLRQVGFRYANEAGDIVYLAHCVSRSGSYLSRLAKLPPGEPLAYLIAPPVEAMMGLDSALKAADVRLRKFFAPPSETNFAGALLTGTRSACEAACEAFARSVEEVGKHPKNLGGTRNGTG